MQGASLLPGIIFVEGSPASQTIVGGASISRATVRELNRWGWYSQTFLYIKCSFILLNMSKILTENHSFFILKI